jgi:hypothetical protein
MKTITFELFLTRDRALLKECKENILKTIGVGPKRLLDVDDNSELSDCYEVSRWISSRNIWHITRRLMLIDGVLDVDPDLTASLNREYRRLYGKERKELVKDREEREKVKKRPNPRWFHKNSGFKDALEYALKEFKAGRGCFDPASTKIPIAQFDTGYTNHPKITLVDRDSGYNYVAGLLRRLLSNDWQRDARDRLRNLRPFLWASHGTATASVIIGSRIKDKNCITGQLRDRVNGVLAHQVDLIPFRISENIISFDNKMIHALDQVIKLGNIPIITMSHASLFRKQSWKKAVENAYRHGIIWIAAGGSHAFGRLRSIIVFPAKFQEPIATAAATVDDLPWERTHYGAEIDICAPGFDIYVPSSRRRLYGLMPEEYTFKWSEGTSFSTPLVAAAAALWIGHHGEQNLRLKYPQPWQRIESFRTLLKSSARPFRKATSTSLYGAGLLDALNLLKAALPDPDSLSPVSRLYLHQRLLTNKAEKNDYISGKEIVYLLACGKIREMDTQNDNLYKFVKRRATPLTKKYLDELVRADRLKAESNPRSEAIKRFGKEFLNTWS